MVMLWEYFALIFVRARSSIVFFSRMAALSFVAFHVYFYHFQMGYFGIAAAAAFCSMLAVKMYVLRAIEMPAYVSGEVSHEQPRAHFVELPCEWVGKSGDGRGWFGSSRLGNLRFGTGNESREYNIEDVLTVLSFV